MNDNARLVYDARQRSGKPDNSSLLQELANALEQAEVENKKLIEIAQDNHDSYEVVKDRLAQAEAEIELLKGTAEDNWTIARQAQAQLAKAVELLRDTSEELSEWGMGDMHYGSQPQEPTVVKKVQKARDFLTKIEGAKDA